MTTLKMTKELDYQDFEMRVSYVPSLGGFKAMNLLNGTSMHLTELELGATYNFFIMRGKLRYSKVA